jgi:DNA polymerase-3 subunit beta
MHVAAIPHVSATRPNLILPRPTALTLARLLPDEEVTLHIGETDLAADLGPVRLHTKLVGGKYPDWRRVVPSGERASATCNTLALHQAVGACSVLSNADYRGIKLTLAPDGENPGIHLSATNQDEEQSDDQIPASVEGDALEAGYNAGYLTQALDAMPGSDVEIAISDSAATLRGSKGEGDADVYAVVMAMRL